MMSQKIELSILPFHCSLFCIKKVKARMESRCLSVSRIHRQKKKLIGVDGKQIPFKVSRDGKIPCLQFLQSKLDISLLCY